LPSIPNIVFLSSAVIGVSFFESQFRYFFLRMSLSIGDSCLIRFLSLNKSLAADLITESNDAGSSAFFKEPFASLT